MDGPIDDPCLVGSWEAVSVTFESGYISGAGGTGFRVTVKPDGTQSVDYSAMLPFEGKPDTISYSGTAEGRIRTRDGVALLDQQTVKGSVAMTLKTPAAPQPIVWKMDGQLGPGGLGVTTGENRYLCNRDTLSYRGSTHRDRRANFPVELKRLPQ